MMFSNKVKFISYRHFGFYHTFVVLSGIANKIRGNVMDHQV